MRRRRGAASPLRSRRPLPPPGRRRALELDSTFAGPLQHSIELTAAAGDTARVLHLGRLALEADSTGQVADYIRWHMATARGDSASIAAIRERFDDMSVAGARAAAAMAERAAAPAESDTAGAVTARLESVLALCGSELWQRAREGTAAADAAARLRRAVEELDEATGVSSGVIGTLRVCAATLPVLEASRADAPGAGAAVARLDSLLRTGPSAGPLVALGNLVLARALELDDEPERALAVVRRRPVGLGVPGLLSTLLRDEGRLAAMVGDTAAAVAAYRDYLALRSDPEPAVREEVERVRAALAALTGERAGR